MSDSAGPPVIPGYHDLEVIGRGGFAVVYRALDEARDRTVAVKVLTLGLDDPIARTLFEREARGAGSLSDHPHIVTLYDSGFVADGRPFLVMEYCPFGSVGASADGPAPLPDVLELGVKLSGALATAHRRGILHRDLKPENILVTQYHEPALCDFGIASLADRGDGMTTLHAMTPTYAAPEVLDLGRASTASDVYGLAATLYRLLAGRPPFGTVTSEGLHRYLTSVLQEPVPPLARTDVPSELESLLAEAMAKAPEDRPAGAEEFGRRLQDVQRSLGFDPTKPTVGEVPSESTEVARARVTSGGDLTRQPATGSPDDRSEPAGNGGTERPAATDRAAADVPPPPPPSERLEVAGDATVASRRRQPAPIDDLAPAESSSSPSTALLVGIAVLVALLVAVAIYLVFR